MAVDQPPRQSRDAYAFFKYWNFFTDSAANLLTSLGLEPNLPMLRILLPVGISFYTFQTLSYVIDVYRRDLEPEPSLIQFALFVSFFPQLVAGPIERAKHLLPQLRSLPTSMRQIDWAGSALLILRGLFRKVVIADGVAPLVNEVFAKPGTYGSVTVAVGVIAFSLQTLRGFRRLYRYRPGYRSSVQRRPDGELQGAVSLQGLQ